MSEQKWVWYFGEGKAGNKAHKAALGGKGVNLSEMRRMGLPIPPGYTITTGACIAYQKARKWPKGLSEQNAKMLAMLEKESGKTLGGDYDPLLVSVRSGAVISMPGMMDTVLNLGLNSRNIKALAKKAGERFAYDSYRRFIQMFADVCLGIERHKFEHILDGIKSKYRVKLDTELTAAAMKECVGLFLTKFKEEAGYPFPEDPRKQLQISIDAVFDSWSNKRAVAYRDMNRISHDLGTAVNVQAMVYGNMGWDCGTGVAFTRDPSTGENVRYGEYLLNAQGEDVVAGIRTPKQFKDMKKEMPEIHDQLIAIMNQLENHYKDMQDIEFTIQDRKLYILQTRNGKRTAKAAVKMAVDMVQEGFITKQMAVMRVSPDQIDNLLHDQFDPKLLKKAKAAIKGLPASPGAAVGQVVFSSEEAVAAKEAGKPVVLVRLETSPEDITGMEAAEGILTARGGMTSHAAVVARGMNKCCVSGCSTLSVTYGSRPIAKTTDGHTIRKGDWISIDGSSGKVYLTKMPVIKPDVGGEVEELLTMADQYRKLGIRANADNPKDALTAVKLGAEGVGLCRTEHMFFNPERILAVREMIMAANDQARDKALAKLLPYQRKDFYGILKAMDSKPVIIRLIDPPLHEFLPHTQQEMNELSQATGIPVRNLETKAASMKEFNPMLGFRGCRLGVVFPAINVMQVTAIFEAALKLVKEGLSPMPQIEIPLVGSIKEYMPLKKMVLDVASKTGAEGVVHYEVGTMIEVPRACLQADKLAKEADFMSFGTNDLTQMTCGFSRDDSGVFLKEYVKRKIYSRDPFQSIDQDGVGRMMQICVALAKGASSKVDIGLCGEHGGEAASVEFCHQIGLDNVSCSPYRVPVARLAAAQAALKHGYRVTKKITLKSSL